VTNGKRKLEQRLLQWQQKKLLERETWYTNVAETIEFSNKRKGELG